MRTEPELIAEVAMRVALENPDNEDLAANAIYLGKAANSRRLRKEEIPAPGAEETREMISRTIVGITVEFDAYSGENRKRADYARFSEIEDALVFQGGGLTGGSHGTSQPYEDYRISPNEVVRKVRPGAQEDGYLQLLPT
jgi:hypothetical protein